MRFRVTSMLTNQETTKEWRLSTVYESFEEVVSKVNRDLQSMWNEIIPFPYNLILELVDDDVPLGIQLADENGDVIAHNSKDVQESLEVAGMVFRDKFAGDEDG